MRNHHLGLLVLIACGASAACSDDGGGEVQPPADTGVETAGETAPPDTGVAETAAPDTSTPDVADAPPPTPTLDFTIINVSDWHGQIDALSETNSATELTTEYGGAAVLSTYFKDARAAGPTITATSGDVTGATPSLSTYGADIPDEPAILTMNFLGLQVDTLGNHNFDRSIAHYTSLIDKTKYAIVSSNLKNIDNTENTCGVLGLTTGPCGIPGNKPDGTPRIVKGYHMITVGTGENAVKVAFLGLTNPDAPKLQFPGLMGKLTVEDPSVRANDLSAQARKDGAQVVIALVHHGATGSDPVTMKPTGPLIDYVTGMNPNSVDLVLGDHTNQRVSTVINGIKVIENLSAGRTYGRTKIHVEKGVVTSVTPEVLDPIGKQSTKKDVLMDTTTMKPVVCKGGTAPVACPTATPAWTCSSTTGADGVCKRSYSCATGGAVMCPTGWTCSTDGTTCTRWVKDEDPAFKTVAAPWRKTLAAKFDVEIAKTTGVFLRGPTCPPGATCGTGGTPTVNLEREYQQPIGDLTADALLASGAGLGGKIAMTNGGGIRSSIPSSYKPALFSSVTSAGTTPPAIALSGTPAAVYSMKIEITTGGAVGTMAFRWSSDGGTSWTSGVTSATTAMALGTTGASVTFAAGTYATDNAYTFTTKVFQRSGCSTTAPCQVLLGDIYSVYPFGNRLTIRPVTAQTLWRALENGVSRKPAADGRFLHPAGFTYSFSVSASVDLRVKTITLNDGTKLMDVNATPPLLPDSGKLCTTDGDCAGASFGTSFTCVEDVDLVKKCMIKVVTNDFVNAGGETLPLAPGAKLGIIDADMAQFIADYVKGRVTLTPGAHNFVAPSTTATTTRIFELP